MILCLHLLVNTASGCRYGCKLYSRGSCKICKSGPTAAETRSAPTASSSSSSSGASSNVDNEKQLPASNVSVQTSLIVLLGGIFTMAVLFAVLLFTVYWNCWRPQNARREQLRNNFRSLDYKSGGPLPEAVTLPAVDVRSGHQEGRSVILPTHSAMMTEGTPFLGRAQYSDLQSNQVMPR